MFFRFLIIGCYVLLLSGKLLSQTSLSEEIDAKKNPLVQLSEIEDPTFYQIKEIYDKYWNTFDKKQPAGWKQYKRWEYFWQTRLMPDGRFPKSDLALTEWKKYEEKYLKKQPKTQSSPKWELVGPTTIPEKYNDARTQGLGRINVIRFDSQDANTIWAGSATGGAWKSTDLGKTWQGFPFTNFMSTGVSDIAIYEKNPSIVYLATGDDNAAYSLGGFYSIGLLKTYDSGYNWNVTSLTKELKDKFVISRILIHPDDFNHLLVATSQGVFKSLDGGKTWNTTLQSGYIKDMEYMPGNPSIVSAVTIDRNYGKASFYHSTNGGDSWQKVHSLSGANRIAITVSSSNPNKVWAIASRYGYNSFHSFLVSSDKGATWDVTLDYTASDNILGRYSGTDGDATEGQGHYDLCIAVNPLDENDIYVGGINIWRSNNGGYSFQRITNWTGGGSTPFVHADHHDLQFQPNSINLFGTNDGGLVFSTNLGASWTNLTNGMSITQYYKIGMSKSDPNLIIGGAQDNGTNMHTSQGWIHLRAGDGMEAAIHPSNDNTLFMEYYNGEIYKSQDKGKIWNKSLTPYEVRDTAAWVTPYIFDIKNPTTMYIGYKNIYKSTQTGSNSSWIKVKNSNGMTFSSLAISPTNSYYVYAATYYDVFMTNDAGKTWNSIYRASGEITYLAVDPNNPKRIWVTVGGYTDKYKIIEYNDGVITNISGNLPNVPVNCIVYQSNSPDRLYIGTDIGVFVSDYNSAFWEPYGEEMPKVVVTELEIFEPGKKLIAATYGRGIWRTDLIDCNLAQPNVVVTGNTEFCEGDSVKLEAEDGFDKYQWSNGLTDKIIYAKESGAYTVRIWDQNGCYSNSKAVIVNVKDLLELKILNGNKTGFCKDGEVKLSASIGYTSYKWSNGAKGRTTIVKEPGYYWVEGTSNNGCSRKSEITEIIEFPMPERPFIDKKGNLLTAKSANTVVSICEWYFNGVKIENIQTDTYLMKEDGLYSVIITDTNGCVSEKSDEFNLLVGVDEKDISYSLSVFPNPGDGDFELLVNSSLAGIITLEVTNLLGEKVIEQFGKHLQSGENIINISLTDYPLGTYYLKIHNNGKCEIRKIIKK